MNSPFNKIKSFFSSVRYTARVFGASTNLQRANASVKAGRSRSDKNAGSISSAAFTLIEAMVAISILSLAVTGPLLIAQKGIGAAVYARDQITAFYLAQEAVEYIRNVRDSNRITGTSWLSQFSSCKETGAGERCRIDARYTDFTAPGAISTCPAGTCPALSYDSSTGLYGYGSGGTWSTTKFTRTISIDDRVASSREAAVSVTISWATTLFSPVRSFTIKEYVFNF